MRPHLKASVGDLIPNIRHIQVVPFTDDGLHHTQQILSKDSPEYEKLVSSVHNLVSHEIYKATTTDSISANKLLTKAYCLYTAISCGGKKVNVRL